MVLAVFFQKTGKTTLVIENRDTGKAVWRHSLDTDSFCLKFIHSVHLTPVYEYYRVKPEGQLCLYKTEYYSYGVGMPTEEENGIFKNDNGKTVLENFFRESDALLLRVSPIPRHSLLIGEEEFFLTDIVPEETGIKIYTEKKCF